MPTLASNPSFAVFGITAVALSVLLVLLWSFTGFVRMSTRTTPNEEDTVVLKAKVTDEQPASVDRMMRVYQNAAANIPPFLILAFVYVLLGAPVRMCWILFGSYFGARVLHAVTYAFKLQPWRTIAYIGGQVVAVFLAVQILRACLRTL
jgi:uncharacterized MAPEG superfamily protein